MLTITYGKSSAASSRRTRTAAAIFVSCLLGCLSAQPASALESKSFVMSRFWHAANNAEDDCPGGINPRYKEQYALDLADLGYSPRDVARIMEKDAGDEGRDFEHDELTQLMVNRGRIDGKPVNAYGNPLAVKDPQLKPWSGKFAYGFDLDGKGVTSTSFEDPESHEKGVKHELARVLGCSDEFRARLREGAAAWLFFWTAVKDAAPAWTITVTGEDLSKDGPVTIKFSRAMEGVKYNGNGSARADMTYRIDTDPRTDHNVYKGKIENGVISVTEQNANLYMLQEPLLYPHFSMDHFHARMQMNKQGVLEVLIGGYQPIDEIYFWCGSANHSGDVNFCHEVPGQYHLLRKFADANPDAKGQNTAISSTYYLEAVPAFLLPRKAQEPSKISR